MSTTAINTEAKGLLAKLLATEDITVEHQPVHTAMFNTESRTLTLPIWENASNSLYDMLVGHEVGHALFTPDVDLEKVLDDMDPTDSIPKGTRMDYLNVVEDARIEKDIQSRFPGLRRDFRSAYNELLERDFFGVAGIDNLGELSFIDRVNLHFKVGTMLQIPFTSEESDLVTMVDECEDFDEVIDTAVTLMNYSASKQEDETDENQSGIADPEGDQQAESDSGNGSADGGEDDSDEGDGEGESLSGSDPADEGSEPSTETDGDGDEKDDSSGPSSSGSSNGPLPEESMTQSALADNLKDMAKNPGSRTRNRQYVTVPNQIDLSNTIVSAQDFLNTYRQCGFSEDKYVRCLKAALDFQKESQKIVGNMVKRFEMRKAAEESKRVMSSDTGILDTIKMINYRWSEDIFLKSSTVEDGQSHGLVMFVDWSGSMSPNIFDTVKQLLVLAMFCKKVNIPFDVYAFTNGWSRRSSGWARRNAEFDSRWDSDTYPEICKGLKVGDVKCCECLHLVNMLSSDLKKSDWIECFTYLFSEGMMQDYNHMKTWGVTNPRMHLGGTPLDDAITAARQVVIDFKSKHGVQVVNTVFLTDGCSGSGPLQNKSWDGKKWSEVDYNNQRVLKSHDGTLFESEDVYACHTETFFRWLRHETGAPVIGIYLTESKYYASTIPDQKDIKSFEKKCESLKNEGAVSCGDARGYSEYIVMMAEGHKKIRGLDDVRVGSNSRVVANAMIREAKKKKGLTKIMDIFVDRICGHGI